MKFVFIGAPRPRRNCEISWIEHRRPSSGTCQPRCWCGAPVYNGHHCTAGHLQTRRKPYEAPAVVESATLPVSLAEWKAQFTLAGVDFFDFFRGLS